MKRKTQASFSIEIAIIRCEGASVYNVKIYAREHQYIMLR